MVNEYGKPELCSHCGLDLDEHDGSGFCPAGTEEFGGRRRLYADGMKWLLSSKLANFIAENKLRVDRGSGWMNWIKNILLMTASIKLIFPVSNTLAMALIPLFLATFWVMGHLDLTWLKWYQTENNIQTWKYNPQFRDRLTLGNIRKIMKEEIKKNGKQ